MEEWYGATLEWCFGAKPPIFFSKKGMEMQIKIFTIPLTGGEALEADLNAFLRGHKILQVERVQQKCPNQTPKEQRS
jgi:hypothetical protein